MAPTTIAVDAILFDMDGTLIDSTPGVFKAWKTFADDYSLGDYIAITHATHGRRLYDTLKEYCKIENEATLIEEINRFEDKVIAGGPMPLPGAIELVKRLNEIAPESWTIVTSGMSRNPALPSYMVLMVECLASNKYAPAALEKAGVPLPPVTLVTSNDVLHGKPHPAPYLAGAEKCKVDPKTCLVVEDAISGLKSGRAAGSKTLVVLTSTVRELIEVSDANPDYIVEDLTKVSVRQVGGKLEVTIDA